MGQKNKKTEITASWFFRAFTAATLLFLALSCQKVPGPDSIQLYQALRKGDMAGLKKISHSLDVNIIADMSRHPSRNVLLDGQRYPALAEAVILKQPEAIRILLDAHADPNLPGNDGITPLMIAARTNQTDVIRQLITAGAVIDQRDHQGYTAFMCAAFEGHLDAMNLLLEKGANINATDNEGNTVLFWSVKYGNMEVVRHLLEKNADPKIKNKHNATVLSVARSSQNTALVKLLESHGDLIAK